MNEKIQQSHKFIEEKISKWDNLGFITSFGKDSMVVHHLLKQHDISDIEIIWVIPPFLPDETIEFAENVIDKWDIDLHRYKSIYAKNDKFMEDVVKGDNGIMPLYERDPESCCQIFKVKPVRRAVKELNLNAWFSGLRGTESEKRSKYTKKWKQGKNNVVKLHPILNWTEKEVWKYIEKHDIPYLPWYDKGYRSLGCEPCSSPGGKTERAGRWKGTQQEGGGCGIHCKPHKK